MAIPKEYDGVAVRPCVWGDPYLSVLLFPGGGGGEETHLIFWFIQYSLRKINFRHN